MVNPINGSDELNSFNNFSSMKDFRNSYKDNLDELDNPNGFMSTETLKAGISKNQFISDQELFHDLNTLTNKNFSSSDVNHLANDNNLSASKTAKAFSKIMSDYISNVNDKNLTSEDNIQTFAKGGNIDMHSVMIAAEKSSTAMQMTLQLRNKLLQAYQEVSKMQI